MKSPTNIGFEPALGELDPLRKALKESIRRELAERLCEDFPEFPAAPKRASNRTQGGVNVWTHETKE